MWRRVTSLSPLISSSISSTLNQTAYKLQIWESFTTEIPTQAKGGLFPKGNAPFVSFVLGGPGTGKGTQCTKIVKNYGFTHLSAGELLRREIAANTEYGTMILNTIKEGEIVPSEVTVSIIQKEMESSDNHKFLIDGFPRSEENRAAFERIYGAEPDLVLFFDCPEEEMVNRVLNRNEVLVVISFTFQPSQIMLEPLLKRDVTYFQGRVDDNIDTVRKRLKVFKALNLPVINYYSQRGKLQTINAVGTEDEIFEQVRAVFAALEVTE